MMSTSTRVLKNTGFLYLKVGISAVSIIFSTRFILKALGVDDFGIYNIVGSVVIMLSFLNESMAAATQRFMSYSEGQGLVDTPKQVFNNSILLHSIVAFFIAIVLLLLGFFAFDGFITIPENRIVSAKYVYYFMIISTVLSVLTVPYNAVLIAHENMLYYSIVGSANAILKLIIAYFLMYAEQDRLFLYGFLMVVISLVDFIAPRIYCRIKYPEAQINLLKFVDKHLLKQMTSFAGWQFLYSSSSILSIQGTSILLNNFFGIAVNAAQGVARQLSGQLMVVSNTLLNALNPVIVKSAGAGNDSSMNYYALVGSKLSYILVVIFSVPVLVEMPFLLNLWLDKVPDYAISFCRFEIIQQMMASITVTLVTSISAKGDIKAFQIFSAITYIVRLPLIFIFLELGYTPMSVYYISTVTVFFLCVGRVYYASKKSGLNINKYLKDVLYPSILVTILMFFISIPLILYIDASITRLLLVSTLSTIALIIGLRYFLITKNEKQLFRNIVIKIRNYAKR